MHKIDTEKYIVSAREAGTEKAEDREEADRLKNYGWRNVSGPQRDEIMAYAEEYMSFLNRRRRERSCFSGDRSAAASLGEAECEKTGGGCSGRKAQYPFGFYADAGSGK